jgi:predicted nucleotidyltransferase component of viral defense system
MSLNKSIHKSILVKILHDIFTDSFLALSLGFKGGTAALFFYDLPRFSVDLDFDLLMQENNDEVFIHMKELLQKYGSLKEAKNMNNGIFFILAYQGKPIGSYNIKVDINKRDFGSTYEVKNYLGIPMKIMVQEDMFAHKLVAMYERMADAHRDIYDVWFFLKKGWPINKEIVKKRTGMSFKSFLEKCIESLTTFNDKNILSGLGDLLSEDARHFVKTKLKNETLFLLRLAHQNAD